MSINDPLPTAPAAPKTPPQVHITISDSEPESQAPRKRYPRKTRSRRYIHTPPKANEAATSSSQSEVSADDSLPTAAAAARKTPPEGHAADSDSDPTLQAPRKTQYPRKTLSRTYFHTPSKATEPVTLSSQSEVSTDDPLSTAEAARKTPPQVDVAVSGSEPKLQAPRKTQYPRKTMSRTWHRSSPSATSNSGTVSSLADAINSMKTSRADTIPRSTLHRQDSDRSSDSPPVGSSELRGDKPELAADVSSAGVAVHPSQIEDQDSEYDAQITEQLLHPDPKVIAHSSVQSMLRNTHSPSDCALSSCVLRLGAAS